MGCCTSSQSSQTTIPGMSAQERELHQMFMAMMPAMMEASGYEMKEESVFTPEETARFDELQKKHDESLEIERQTGMKTDFAKQNGEYNEWQAFVKKEQAAGGKTTKKVTKKLPYELEKLKKDRGEDSVEFMAAKEEYDKAQGASRQMEDDIAQQFRENSLKFLKGDFSTTEAERASIEEQLKPLREGVEKMYGELEEVNMEGFKGLFDRHEKAVEANKMLLKDQIQEYSDDVMENVANQAAMTGRDPTDPEFQNQIATNIAKVTGQSMLQLASDARREEMGIAQSEFGAKQDLTQARGTARLSLEEQALGLRMQKFSPQGLNMAMNASQLTNAISQQRMQNLSSIGSGYQSQAQGMRQERMVQQNTTQTSVPSPMSLGVGLLQGGFGVYSGMAQAGALRDLANKYKR